MQYVVLLLCKICVSHIHRPWRIHIILSPLLFPPHPRYDPRVVSDLDLPADLFRAQLVCEALNTCGAYYVRGQAKERLSRYLVYFQRYLLSKPLLPTHIEFAILDTFDNLEELARSAAIASAVKLKSAAPALKVLNCLPSRVFYNYFLILFFFIIHRLEPSSTEISKNQYQYS